MMCQGGDQSKKVFSHEPSFMKESSHIFSLHPNLSLSLYIYIYIYFSIIWYLYGERVFQPPVVAKWSFPV